MVAVLGSRRHGVAVRLITSDGQQAPRAHKPDDRRGGCDDYDKYRREGPRWPCQLLVLSCGTFGLQPDSNIPVPKNQFRWKYMSTRIFLCLVRCFAPTLSILWRQGSVATR